MPSRSDRILTFVALFVIAPIGAAVVISVLLLFGATPHVVFCRGSSPERNSPPSACVLRTPSACWSR